VERRYESCVGKRVERMEVRGEKRARETEKKEERLNQDLNDPIYIEQS
jgi:hypothetical protein